MNLPKNLSVNASSHLTIGGCDCIELAQEFGTPLYVLDAQLVRERCRLLKAHLKKEYGDSTVLYAGKALSMIALYQLLASEDMGCDVVSGGELYGTLQGGVRADSIYFHGNNKLKSELEYAVEQGIHCIVVDSYDEVDMLNQICERQNKVQNVMVRINSGVEAHTHEYVKTTKSDSKFGFLASSGDALQVVGKIANCSNLKYIGLHCHIGSQIFETLPYKLSIGILATLAQEIAQNFGLNTQELNVGGGFGIRYTHEDNALSPLDFLTPIAEWVKHEFALHNLPLPKLVIEPGRSIVGEAGITLYTVGAIREIAGVRKYVSVDGGMFDNPRFALYQAKYQAVVANRAHDVACDKVTIVGKCCESGDVIIKDGLIAPTKRDDILAVLCTGAYNYSMASNYNKNAIPPVVMVENGKARLVVRPQTFKDLFERDIQI